MRCPSPSDDGSIGTGTPLLFSLAQTQDRLAQNLDRFLVRPHESAGIWQFWLRKEHVRKSSCDAGGLAYLDLDSIVWEPGKVAVQRPCESVAASLRSFIDSQAAWVIEGCYGELVRAASTHCTLLVFLNPGMEACLANNLRRAWEPHKYASLELQNTMLSQLQEWVAGYYQRTVAWSYRVHREIFDAFAGPKTEHHELGAYAA